MDDRSTEESREAIIGRLNDWQKVLLVEDRNFDFKNFADLYWQDESTLTFHTMAQPSSRLRGWHEIAAFYQPIYSGLVTWQVEPIDTIEIAVSGDLAYTALVFRARGRGRIAHTVVIQAHATLVWQNRCGEWRILHEHISMPARL
jgi:ketosteroid isomerase-like protein